MSSFFVIFVGNRGIKEISDPVGGVDPSATRSPLSHLDGRGHRSALAQLDASQRALPVVADVDFLV